MLLSIHHILPLSALIINFLVIAFIFAKDSKSSTNRAYLLFLLGLQLFCIGDLHFRLVTVPNYNSIILLKLFPLTYLTSGYLFLRFVYYLLNKDSDIIYIFVQVVLIIIVGIHLTTSLIADEFEQYSWGYHISPGILALYVNALVTILPILIALFYIAKEIKTTEIHNNKSSLILLFFGTIIAWSIAIYSNVFFRAVFDSTEHIRLASSASVFQTLLIIPALLKYNFLNKPSFAIIEELFECSPDNVIIANNKGDIVKMNKQAKLFIGDILNVNLLFHPNIYFFKKEYSNKEFLLNSGHTVTLSQSKILQDNLNMGKLLVLHDISDKVKIRKSLLKSESHFKEAQSIARIGSFEYDILLDKISWSEEIYNLFGLDSKVFNPTKDYFINNILHPDDKEYVIKLIEDAYQNKSNLDYFHRIVRGDGEVRFMHSQARIQYNKHNSPVKINGSTQDITDLHITQEKLEKSEKEYKTLVETSPDSIIIATLDTFFYVNNAFVSMMHAKSKDDFDNKSPLEFMFQEDFDYIKDKVKKLFSGEPVQKRSFKYKRCDKTEGYVEIRGVLTSYNDNPAFLGAIRDVTEMYQTQQALIESEKQYRFLVENSTDIIYNTDLNGNFIYTNQAFEDISGYTTSEVLGKDSNNHVRADYKEKVIKIYHQQFLEKKQNNIIEVPVIDKIGGELWLELNIGLMWDGDKISGFSAVCRNITEKRRIKKQLQETHEKLESIFDAIPDLFFMLKKDGTILEYKADSTDKLYTSPEQFIGKKVTDILPSPASEIIQKALVKQQTTNKLTTLEYTLEVEGILQYFEARLLPYQQSFIITIVRNITDKVKLEKEKKETEERYRLLVESSPDGIVLHDTKKIIFLNSALLKLSGLKNANEIIGKDPNLFVHPDFLEISKRRIKRILNGEDLDPIYEKMVRTDGKVVMVEAKGILIYLDGKPVMQTTIRDVSQRIKAENEIKKSHEQIRKLAIHLQHLQEEERERIAKEIHDELGQTLTGIKMDLSFLHRTNKDTKIAERLEAVDGLVDRSIKTVRKISSGLHPPVLDDLGLKAAIEWQIHEFFARSQIKYTLDLSDADIEFSKDKSHAIFRIIQESLTNVARHSKATKVTVISKLQENNMVFEIKDNGVGISKNSLDENSTFGIISMKERALVFNGKIEITGKNSGTLVKLSIPVDKIGDK